MEPTLKLSSPIETPEAERIYVVEYPTLSRIKLREVDVDAEIENIDREIALKEERREELVDFKDQITQLKKDAKKKQK